ncbi:Ribosomal L28e protein family protein [Cryptosporidium meleagridis]|uniref:Protein MAK16 homolog n=1 Tax=Cryptosporidium meleagridis TaxID=93969 RepID=A0A2P4YYI3_9CRYT|nr:Ribosomal L28e protein family protein [Cryptosporidium meleagridis]
MNDPELIWNSVSNNFCSFKVKCDKTSFCRNEYNVTGLCNRTSCPLSNLLYATVIEHEGDCYLYMKTAERAHTPRYLWEKIKLSNNFLVAISQINDNLKNVYPEHQILKCKHRLTRIRQTLIRARKMALTVRPKLVPIKKKTERREASREHKALNAAKIENEIENELLLRLKEGLYDGIYNYPTNKFEKTLDNLENITQDEVSNGDSLEDELAEYIEDIDDDSEDEIEAMHKYELRKILSKKKKINLEYEVEEDIKMTS